LKHGAAIAYLPSFGDHLDRRPYADLTAKPETIGLEMKTGDPSVAGKRSPAVGFLI
jgi:hypothetical protein